MLLQTYCILFKTKQPPSLQCNAVPQTLNIAFRKPSTLVKNFASTQKDLLWVRRWAKSILKYFILLFYIFGIMESILIPFLSVFTFLFFFCFFFVRKQSLYIYNLEKSHEHFQNLTKVYDFVMSQYSPKSES